MTKPKREHTPIDSRKTKRGMMFFWVKSRKHIVDPILSRDWFVAINLARNAVGRRATEKPYLACLTKMLGTDQEIPRYVRDLLAELIDPEKGTEHWRFYPRRRSGVQIVDVLERKNWSKRLSEIGDELRNASIVSQMTRMELIHLCDPSSRYNKWYLSPKIVRNHTIQRGMPVPRRLLKIVRYNKIYTRYAYLSGMKYNKIDDIENLLNKITIGSIDDTITKTFIIKYKKIANSKRKDNYSWDEIIYLSLPRLKYRDKLNDIRIRDAVAEEFQISLSTVDRAIRHARHALKVSTQKGN